MALAAIYAVYDIIKIRTFYSRILTPGAEFMVKNPETTGNQSPLTIVEFINYDCGICRQAHLVFLDYAESNRDIRYVARPVPYANGEAEYKAKIALAAGLQDRFGEMDRALSEYDGPVNERFLKETASLYELDFEKWMTDIEGKEVFALAKNNANASQSLGLEKTPAFMIGKTIYEPDAPLTLSDLIRMVHKEKNK